MRKYFQLFALLLFLETNTSFAQLNNTFLSDKIIVNTNDSNTWGIIVNNFNYLRNTEYFNAIESGRTLFGYQLNPQLYVQPFARVKLQAGVFVQSDFGAIPIINKVLPTFTIKFLSKSQTESFTFGTLEGALAHKLIEPLWDINSAIQRRIENGAQFKSERKKLFVDAWINWERFIERESPFKEQFTAGLNLRPTLFENANGFFINTPLQVTAFHRGGQIDTDTSNMIMQVNAALGLQVGNLQASNTWKWQTEVYYTHYQENSNSGYFPYRNGNGLFANAAISRNRFTLVGSYWQGNQWMAPRGTVLYQSVSIDKLGVVDANRQLLFIRLLYAKELRNNLTLSARVEPVYDVKASLLDFSYSLYISYRLKKVLGKL